MKRYTINNPHPDHIPVVGRIQTGLSWSNGQMYGTTLRCSCPVAFGKVSNEAPSRGGRAVAQRVYRTHLMQSIDPSEYDNGMRDA